MCFIYSILSLARLASRLSDASKEPAARVDRHTDPLGATVDGFIFDVGVLVCRTLHDIAAVLVSLDLLSITHWG